MRRFLPQRMRFYVGVRMRLFFVTNKRPNRCDFDHKVTLKVSLVFKLAVFESSQEGESYKLCDDMFVNRKSLRDGHLLCLEMFAYPASPIELLQPHAEEAKYFVELRMLQQDVQVIIRFPFYTVFFVVQKSRMIMSLFRLSSRASPTRTSSAPSSTRRVTSPRASSGSWLFLIRLF